jgi:methionyl-tRNA synthetase
MSDRFYITTPIYYPNGEPHLGSVYTTVICDVLARFHRLLGKPTFFLTGTDEHGTKMAKAAATEGAEPQALADKYADIFRSVWRELEISNDDFIRTTEPRHKTAVTNIVKKMLDSGDIYLGGYEGWYDEGQEQFVTETEAKTLEFKSSISGKPLVRYSEPTYFFKLAKYVPLIIAYIEEHPHFIIPESRRNEVLSKLRAGVEDLSISRATLKWGIPMPHDPGHVIYVWIDALTNYITALGYASDNDSLYRKFWPGVHVIGKDILWFHAVYWPAMLMSLGEPLPKTIAAHGWWVRGGKKAGKSTGGITTMPEIRELSSKYTFDSVRYHLLRAAPFGNDLEWSDTELEKSITELGNVVGNALNRVVSMIGSYRARSVPAPHHELEDIDRQLVERMTSFPALLRTAYESLDLQSAATLPVELARAVNGYIDATAPFKLKKDPAQQHRLDTILNLSANAMRKVLIGLLPILPRKAAEGLTQLNVILEGQFFDGLMTSDLAVGHVIGQGQPLFPKVEKDKA